MSCKNPSECGLVIKPFPFDLSALTAIPLGPPLPRLCNCWGIRLVVFVGRELLASKYGFSTFSMFWSREAGAPAFFAYISFYITCVFVLRRGRRKGLPAVPNIAPCSFIKPSAPPCAGVSPSLATNAAVLPFCSRICFQWGCFARGLPYGLVSLPASDVMGVI